MTSAHSVEDIVDAADGWHLFGTECPKEGADGRREEGADVRRGGEAHWRKGRTGGERKGRT